MIIGDNIVEVPVTLDGFLASVEKRAYRMAMIACGNREDALDIVQDAMLKLVGKYSQREHLEWGPLFHRILQTTIRDWYRRSKVRSQWRVSLAKITAGFRSNASQSSLADQDSASIEQFADQQQLDIDLHLMNDNAIQALDQALHQLPLRQQQAFLLRIWEGLNVAETAQAMACSQGSVKTHFSRAVHTLRRQLKDHRHDQ